MNLFYLAVSSLLLGLLCAWLTALVQIPFSHALARMRQPRFSSRFWFSWGMLSPAGGAVTSLSVVLFGIFSGAGWLDDHCLSHPGHPHLCLTHIPLNPPGGGLFWAVLGLAALGAARGCWRTGRLWRTTRRWVAGATCDQVAGRQVLQVAGNLPTAFTAGLWSPRLYWTRTAKELLNDQEREIVLAHEEEHQRRRDPLRLLLLEWRRGWLPGGGQVVRHWERQAEIECDLSCLGKGFAPVEVASTVLKLQRGVIGVRRRNLSLAYARHDPPGLRQRIEALFEKPRSSLGMAPAGTLLLLLSALLFSRLDQAHHLFETALGWLQL